MKIILSLLLLISLSGFGQAYNNYLPPKGSMNFVSVFDEQDDSCQFDIKLHVPLDTTNHNVKKGTVFLLKYSLYEFDGKKWNLIGPFGGNRVYNNITIKGSDEQYIPTFIQTKHQQSKTDTVKGWIRYYGYPKNEGDVKRSELIIWDEEYKTGAKPLVLFTERAISVYRKAEKNTYYGEIHTYDPEHGYLLDILINGVSFDLWKKYEFIKDDEIVK